MPTLADITIKKADGSTNLTYNGISSGAADGTDALWRAESIGTVAGNRPTLTIRAKSSKDKSARLLDWSFNYPETVTDSTTGIVRIINRPWGKGTFCQLVGASDQTNKEAAAQMANLLGSALVQAIFSSGSNAR